MASGELLVVILNHTNDELDLEPDSLTQILAGESGMLRCKSSHVGAGVSGSVTYRVVGYEESYKVTFLWSVPYVGQNKFDSLCAAEGFAVRMLGGKGNQAVAVFVFEPVQNQRFEGNVGTAVIKGPVECAEAPLGRFH
ncbi:hypothetical protein NCS52_01113700 [Fusarium sp. LHS14.1]|nr:hypothetical protein NCS52_01113700 [Fusarium sp. LHS14.1]